MGRRRKSRRNDYQENEKPFRSSIKKSGPSNRELKSEPDVAADITKDTGYHEVPGFYYDLDSKTYFRITPENSSCFAEKKRKLDIVSEISKLDQKTSLKRKQSTFTFNVSVTYGLFQREYNRITSESFCNQVQRTRIKMLKEVSSSLLDDSHGEVENCQIMIGNPSQGSVIGSWRTTDRTIIFQHCMKDSPTDKVYASSIVNILYMHQVADMCCVKIRDGLEFVLYVCNPLRPSPIPALNLSTVHLTPIRQYNTTSSEIAMLADGLTVNMEFDKLALWSCTWNNPKNTMAFGSEGLIMVYTVDENPTNLQSFTATGENIFSLEFDQPGVSLFCGTNKGFLKTFDMRTQNVDSNIKLFRGLSYLKLLDSGNQILASCYDHKLLQVDLRMGKPVVEYAGHKNEHLRIPFTFSEKSNFLCSLGQDNVTRFWNVTNGAAISTLPPPNGTSTFRPWAWYSDEWVFNKDFPESALIINYGQNIVTYKS